MATYSVTAGQTSTSLTLNNGDGLIVYAGGSAVFTTVNSGGIENDDGTDVNATVNNGGAQYVASGGSAMSATVSGGGTEVVFAGGSTFSTTVSSGGIEGVFSGGAANDTSVTDGGELIVLPGGQQTGTMAPGGAIVSSGVVLYQPASGFTVLGPRASNVVVVSGAIEYVLTGGTAIGTTVNDGGAEIVFGTVSGATVNNGATEVVSSGGAASFTTVNASGTQNVSAGGTAISAAVNGGGSQNVAFGGSAVGTLVDGGSETVSFSGTTVSTTVNGGFETVSNGGSATDTLVNSAGTEAVLSGGTTLSTMVNSSGVEGVFSGGAASFTTLSSGGTLVVLPGGTQTGTVLSGGAIVSTGVVLYQPIFGFTVYGPHASDVVVSGGATEYVLSGGTAVSTTLNSGGDEVVSSGFSVVSFTSVSLGGAIDVVNLPYAPGGSASVNSASDVLTVSVGGGGYTQQLAGDYTDVRFLLGTDAGSGTLVTGVTRCFRSGTCILTDRGEIAVEVLRIGDRVRTVLGEATAPIVWIGRREVDCARHRTPVQVWPVRVAAGAFGPGRPGRALFLSRDHAVYVNAVLIPIRHLVNGRTIVQMPVDRVCYYHIELPRHDVVLAQGLPAESFLDMRDGSNYARRHAPVRLYPDYAARMWEAFGCARLVVTGTELAAARALVARFAAIRDAA